VYVPSGFPGFNPIFLNWSLIYLTESSSPFVPGARPSNSSDARTLMCASSPSGVIVSSAGCKRNAKSSAAKRCVALNQRITANHHRIFTIYADVVAAFVSNAELGQYATGAWHKRLYNYRLSCEGPAGAFFFSSGPMPIFFRNGWIDCLRPRNFSMETLTSRESPGS